MCYTAFILYLEVVNAGFWPRGGGSYVLQCSVMKITAPWFLQCHTRSSWIQGTAPTMAPALQLTVERLEPCVGVSVSVFQIYKCYITKIHTFILCTNWDGHPSPVRSLFWIPVPRFALSAIASSETYAATHPECCQLQSGQCHIPFKWCSNCLSGL